jgi:hypothetical protein
MTHSPAAKYHICFPRGLRPRYALAGDWHCCNSFLPHADQALDYCIWVPEHLFWCALVIVYQCQYRVDLSGRLRLLFNDAIQIAI